jgi:hypothetical protein
MSCETVGDHIDIVDSHPVQSLRGLKAPQLGIAQAATCFRFLGGVLEEGIQLGANASIQDPPPLFVGKSYVMVSVNNPCRVGGDFVVRSASIFWAGKTALLCRRNGNDQSVLVHVNTQFARVKGTKFKEAFSSKIITDGKVIAWDTWVKNEVLVWLKPDETIEVLYADGNVRSLVNDGGSLTVKALSTEDVADIRVRYLRQAQARVREELKGTDRIRAEDKLYHELVAVLAVGGTRSPAVFESVYSLLEDDGDRGLLGQGVQRHVLEVLQHRPDYALRFKISCASRGAVEKPGAGVPKTAPVAKTSGPPAARRAKLAARSARDREERNIRRGAHGGGEKKSSKKK